MRIATAFFVLALIAPAARGEEMWRWKDANGTLHYSNQADVVPADAVPVTTRLIVEADRLPGAPDDGTVTTVQEKYPRTYQPHAAKPHRIYSEARRRFDCYAANVVYAGGWGHPDDIAQAGNCLPYLLGPEAWLNSARAELALREHGLDWREVVQMYLADQEPVTPRRVTTVDDVD
jgi:uncharacterized protein DUF4124